MKIFVTRPSHPILAALVGIGAALGVITFSASLAYSLASLEKISLDKAIAVFFVLSFGIGFLVVRQVVSPVCQNLARPVKKLAFVPWTTEESFMLASVMVAVVAALVGVAADSRLPMGLVALACMAAGIWDVFSGILRHCRGRV